MCDIALNKAQEYCSSQYVSCDDESMQQIESKQRDKERNGEEKPNFNKLKWYRHRHFHCLPWFFFCYGFTCSSLMATHEFDGKPCNIGTRNCKHPLQWPINSIIQIKLNIRINTDAIFKNCTRRRRKRSTEKEQEKKENKKSKKKHTEKMRKTFHEFSYNIADVFFCCCS